MSKHLRKIAAGMMLIAAVFAVVSLVIVVYPLVYNGRIYRGVSVQDVPLDGLSVEEAASLLSHELPDPKTQTVTLRMDSHSWQLSWADAGYGYKWAATARAAYQVGRQGRWYAQFLSPWRVRFQKQSVEPHIDPADESLVKSQVATIADHIHLPPTDAALLIVPGGVSCVSGKPGRAFDVETTTKRVIDALRKKATEVEIATVSLPPDLLEAEPGCTEAKNLLSRPFTLVADDPLTDYQASFEASPDRVATWLRAATVGDGVQLRVDRGAVRAWVAGVAPRLGTERIFDSEETLRRMLVALDSGDHQAQSAIRHPEETYVVEPGDTLFDIAYNHGFPQWRLEEANPDIEPDQLLVGMELTIPSIDVLFPEPLVPGKRIEIHLPEQRLRAYEHDEMAFEFTVSSGMTKTPTIAGQFQILFKEPEAYAQRWSLDMPYFMAIYYERPDFANGIHELPIRANGQRLWASILGWPASYGCIILNVGDAQKLYDWAPVGTLVRIEGVAPGTPLYVPTYDEQAAEG